MQLPTRTLFPSFTAFRDFSPDTLSRVRFDAGATRTLGSHTLCTISISIIPHFPGTATKAGFFEPFVKRGSERVGEYYPGGQLKAVAHFKDGVPVGTAREYYESGGIKYMDTYKNGEKGHLESEQDYLTE